MVVRAWLSADDGSTFLYYSVEHSPESIHRASKRTSTGSTGAKVEPQPREVPGKLVLEAAGKHGRSRLILTQARPAALQQKSARGTTVDIEWILAEIENHLLAAPVRMVVIDNVGLLLTDLEYLEKRAALLETRRRLLESGIHGIFVMEEAHPRDLRLPWPKSSRPTSCCTCRSAKKRPTSRRAPSRSAKRGIGPTTTAYGQLLDRRPRHHARRLSGRAQRTWSRHPHLPVRSRPSCRWRATKRSSRCPRAATRRSISVIRISTPRS